jgi:integrase/recombinase XerD
VFFNYLYNVEREIPKNPVEKVGNPKAERKMKKTLTPEELKKVFGQFETSTFHG